MPSPWTSLRAGSAGLGIAIDGLAPLLPGAKAQVFSASFGTAKSRALIQNRVLAQMQSPVISIYGTAKQAAEKLNI
jgi:hypothetical protein